MKTSTAQTLTISDPNGFALMAEAPNIASPSALFKVELGEPLPFSVMIEADGCVCANCGDTDGYASLDDFIFKLFEANGTTPVAVFEEVDPPVAPEPAAPLLMALGLLAFGWTRGRYR